MRARQLSKIGGAVVVLLVLLYVTFVHHLDITEVGIRRNYATGETSLENVAGFYLDPPWIWVAKIDTRPRRVCISSASRAINCRLAQFDPDHWTDFVAMEGFHYYWWYNRVSFNWGYHEEYRGMDDILRGYAFAAKQYPFIKVTDEYAP